MRPAIFRDRTDTLRGHRRVVLSAELALIAVLFSAITPLPGAAVTRSEVGTEIAQTNGGDNQEPALAPGRVTCDEAPKVFELLCTAYELITARYVDPVENQTLAAAAAQRVQEADLAERTEGTPPACPLPAPEFEETCAAIDAIADTAAAVEMAIRGMARSLDRNSDYLTAEQDTRFRARLENTGTSGLGIAFGLIENNLPCSTVSTTCRPVIAEVYPGSPAEMAGLMVGDVLVELGEAFPADLSCTDVARLDRFDTGEDVAVTVRRGEETVAATIQTADLTIPVARGMLVDRNIGYLRLDIFSTHADEEAAAVLNELMNPPISGLVLDLRGNPGGYVNSAIRSAGVFLPDLSTIVHLVSREEVETVRARGKEVAPDPTLLPMVVVVDGSSASASEMLTGALRDQGRATVVGERTFGKDTGQSSYRLGEDGTPTGVLHITTLRWYTPLSQSVAEGIEPDVVMDLPSCLLPSEVARMAISAVRPRVADVAITSRPPLGDTYKPGQTMTVTVTFTSPVVVRRGGAPVIKLRIGKGDRYAVYESGSDTTELVFEYIVAAGDSDPDGVSVTADSIHLAGAAIHQPAGLNAVLAHDALVSDPRHRVSATEPVDPDALFADIQGNVHKENIERIAAAGITLGCDRPDNNRFCPDQAVTRAQMATFLARALKLREATRDHFTDDDGTIHEDNVNRLAEARITLGCDGQDTGLFCPQQEVTRAQMAAFIARALGLVETFDSFSDIDESPHRDNIRRIAAAGITLGCDPPSNDRFCPDQVITRDQMATFLARVLMLLPAR